MNKEFKLYILILIFSFFLTGCYGNVPTARKETFPCMGTEVEVILVTPQEGDIKLDRIFERIKSECRRFETKFSIFNSQSVINNLNKSKQSYVDDETEFLLSKAIHIANITHGGFDFTVAPLLKVWGFYSGDKLERLPNQKKIQSLMKYVGYKKITLELDKNLVIKKDKKVNIDLSGIAKGFFVDKIVRLLKTNNINNALVNAGGDMYCLGKSPRGKKWKIGVQHPRKKQDIIAKLNLSNMAIATSGDYENYFFIKDKRYSHIINPFTGYPVSNKPMSVTIIAPDTTTADGLATACMVLGKEKGLDLINSLEDVEGVIVTGEEKLKVFLSHGLKKSKYEFMRK